MVAPIPTTTMTSFPTSTTSALTNRPRRGATTTKMDAPMLEGLLTRAALLLPLMAAACTPQGDPGLGPDGYTDDFERRDLGSAWNNTGGPYKIVDGQLKVSGAKNKPLWLRRAL